MNNKRRKKRVRAKINLSKKRPRLTVFRSNKKIYAQIIDQDGQVLAAFSSAQLKDNGKRKEEAVIVGEKIAQLAKKKKVTSVVFDRGAYQYHGRVKALAEGARKGGLKF